MMRIFISRESTRRRKNFWNRVVRIHTLPLSLSIHLSSATNWSCSGLKAKILRGKKNKLTRTFFSVSQLYTRFLFFVTFDCSFGAANWRSQSRWAVQIWSCHHVDQPSILTPDSISFRPEWLEVAHRTLAAQLEVPKLERWRDGPWRGADNKRDLFSGRIQVRRHRRRVRIFRRWSVNSQDKNVNCRKILNYSNRIFFLFFNYSKSLL